MFSFSAENIEESMEVFFDGDIEIAKDCFRSLANDVALHKGLFKQKLSVEELKKLKRVAHRWKASFKMFGQVRAAAILDALEKSDIETVIASQSFLNFHSAMLDVLENVDNQLRTYDT